MLGLLSHADRGKMLGQVTMGGEWVCVHFQKAGKRSSLLSGKLVQSKLVGTKSEVGSQGGSNGHKTGNNVKFLPNTDGSSGKE